MDKYHGDYRTRHFKCWYQLVCMMFAHIRQENSLRDIDIALNAHARKLYHIGIQPCPKSTPLPNRLWANHFGHAGRDLLKIGDLTDGWDGFDKEIIGKAMTPEAGRVRERLALSCHAGLLASRRGIVPWTGAQIRSVSMPLPGGTGPHQDLDGAPVGNKAL
jgi:hypothetical protein